MMIFLMFGWEIFKLQRIEIKLVRNRSQIYEELKIPVYALQRHAKELAYLYFKRSLPRAFITLIKKNSNIFH